MMEGIGDITRFEDIDMYRKAKIKMIEGEFMIKLSAEERSHIRSLDNEAAIDRYGRKIILDHLN